MQSSPGLGTLLNNWTSSEKVNSTLWGTENKINVVHNQQIFYIPPAGKHTSAGSSAVWMEVALKLLPFHCLASNEHDQKPSRIPSACPFLALSCLTWALSCRETGQCLAALGTWLSSEQRQRQMPPFTACPLVHK